MPGLGFTPQGVAEGLRFCRSGARCPGVVQGRDYGAPCPGWNGKLLRAGSLRGQLRARRFGVLGAHSRAGVIWVWGRELQVDAQQWDAALLPRSRARSAFTFSSAAFWGG